MTLRPARMDLTGAAKQPLFCPRPSASSAVLSPSLCAFHAAPSLSAAECHPRPLPVRFIKPVGDEVKAWRQLFSPASLFQTRDLVHRLQDGATLYGASDISGCLPHSSSSGPCNYTPTWGLRKREMKWYEKKSLWLEACFSVCNSRSPFSFKTLHTVTVITAGIQLKSPKISTDLCICIHTLFFI